jgi:spermidine/putrescine transport system ATP-binding protein
MTGIAVELEGVHKRFGEFEAVKEMSLQIRQGEFFSLLGPSGCGKTTTLRLIAGFEQPTAGAIKLDGEDVAHVPPYKRNVNTVFQSYALFEHLDIAENVAFGLRRRKVAKAEIEQRVGEALELVALDSRARSRPAQLSGGQRQRVALARALVNRPSVLLLDEPLGALDLQLRKQMQVELKRIQREVGITFIYVTHDQEEALAMSDRIAVMHDGVVEQLGAPEEIYEHPLKPFVAGFIGISNLLPATVENGGVRLSGCDAVVDATVPAGLGQGEAVHLSVRPEKLWIDELEPGMCSVEGTIAERVYLGTMTQIIVELAPDSRVIALEQNTSRARADDRWELGDRVRIGWHPRHGQVLR